MSPRTPHSLPPVMPFRWACAYGEDRTGLWQAFEVAGVRHEALASLAPMLDPKSERVRM